MIVNKNSNEDDVVFLQRNALQKTRSFIQTQKKIHHFTIVENSLEYYINEFLKLKEKKVDFEFINELLDDGVNINHLSKSDENVLFNVLITLYCISLISI